jgi:hypothetical protein
MPELTEVISLRLSKTDKRLLERVAAKIPAARTLAVARMAMLRGLTQLDEETAKPVAIASKRKRP